jgi:hypothetical protein
VLFFPIRPIDFFLTETVTYKFAYTKDIDAGLVDILTKFKSDLFIGNTDTFHDDRGQLTKRGSCDCVRRRVFRKVQSKAKFEENLLPSYSTILRSRVCSDLSF